MLCIFIQEKNNVIFRKKIGKFFKSSTMFSDTLKSTPLNIYTENIYKPFMNKDLEMKALLNEGPKFRPKVGQFHAIFCIQ